MMFMGLFVILFSAVSCTAGASVTTGASEQCNHSVCKGNLAKEHLELMKSQKKEVWLLDQCDTHKLGGGVLYVYDELALDTNGNVDKVPIAIDLAEASNQSGCPIGKRPHMMSAYNHFISMSYVVISYVGSGDIQVLDVKTKKIVACLRTLSNGSLGGSFQNHYAEFTPDGKHIIVVDIGGSVKNEKQSGYLHTLKFDCVEHPNCSLKLIHSLSLHQFTEQLGVELARPICGGFDPKCDCHLFYLTISTGGFIIANFTGSSMEVVQVYNKELVKGDGCGGVRRFKHRYSLVTNGASTGKKDMGDYLYFWDTKKACAGDWNTVDNPIEMELEKYNRAEENDPLYDSTPYGNIPLGDTHGVATCVAKDSHREILLTFMRLSNEVILVDPNLRKVVGRKSLVNLKFARNPTPDISTLLTMGGGRICYTMRGPYPLSAISSFVDISRTPGMMCLHMTDDCLDFTFTKNDIFLTTQERCLNDQSDPHANLLVIYESSTESED